MVGTVSYLARRKAGFGPPPAPTPAAVDAVAGRLEAAQRSLDAALEAMGAARAVGREASDLRAAVASARLQLDVALKAAERTLADDAATRDETRIILAMAQQALAEAEQVRRAAQAATTMAGQGNASAEAARALAQQAVEAAAAGNYVTDVELEGKDLVVIHRDGTRSKVALPSGKSGNPSSVWTNSGGGGASALQVKSVSTSYQMAAADDVVEMGSADATTVTLIAAANWAKRARTVKNVGAGICTVTGAETIDGLTSIALDQWESITLYVGGGLWRIK